MIRSSMSGSMKAYHSKCGSGCQSQRNVLTSGIRIPRWVECAVRTVIFVAHIICGCKYPPHEVPHVTWWSQSQRSLGHWFSVKYLGAFAPIFVTSSEQLTTGKKQRRITTSLIAGYLHRVSTKHRGYRCAMDEEAVTQQHKFSGISLFGCCYLELMYVCS